MSIFSFSKPLNSHVVVAWHVFYFKRFFVQCDARGQDTAAPIKDTHVAAFDTLVNNGTWAHRAAVRIFLNINIHV